MNKEHKLGLGGGCHWCTEAVMQAVPGVLHVDQGYIASVTPHEQFSEAVLVTYNDAVDLELLIDIHLETHASTVNHSRRDDYRSAIYCMDNAQIDAIGVVVSSLSRKRNKQYITAILPFKEFKPSRESLQDYFKTRPEAPFCKRYIAPKLEQVQAIIKNGA
jgi:peptide-methionine (S)-S-oxide reductase